MLDTEQIGDLKIIGLGPGKFKDLTLAAYEALQKADKLFLRTREHPITTQLVEKGIEFATFDEIYERESEFKNVHKKIVQEIEDQLKAKREVSYAVPGNPLITEETVQYLLAKVPEQKTEIIPGRSCLEALFWLLGIDPAEKMQILAGPSFEQSAIQPEQDLILTQVYNQSIASDIKLSLLEIYPESHLIQVVKAAGVPKLQNSVEIPLYKLDRLEWINHLTNIYIPPLESESEVNLNKLDDFYTLVSIMERLRGPEGCPWDLKQDHDSLRPYLIEETYEVLERIETKDITGLCEELGDLLLQVVFHAQVAKEERNFEIGDIIYSISEKMIRRHPHVFGAEDLSTANDVLKKWKEIKASEKSKRVEEDSILEVTAGLPALMEAQKVQEQVAEVGFDWPEIEGAIEKLEEELKEFKVALVEAEAVSIKEELGDVLFAIVNVGRFLDLNLELVLRDATQKFRERFKYIESEVKGNNNKLQDMSLDKLESLWQEAKEELELPKGGEIK